MLSYDCKRDGIKPNRKIKGQKPERITIMKTTKRTTGAKRVILITLAVCLLLAVLTSCGGNLSKPKNGTYKSDEGLLSQTWTFSGTNDITLSTGGGLISSKGTYKINGNKLTITSSLFGVESTSGYTITEITSKSFFIDGTKFIKQ